MSVLSTQYSVEFKLVYDTFMFYVNSVFTESLNPPPLLREDKKPPLLDFIWSPTTKAKITPESCISAIGDLKAKITHNFGENQHAIGKKKNGLRMNHLHPFIKKFSGRPRIPTILREDKKSLLGFIWSSKSKVKILPHHVYRSFEGKNYTDFWGRILPPKKNGRRMHYLHPIFKNVPGEGPDPNLQKRYSPFAPSPKRRFVPISLPPPGQWTLWIHHCSMLLDWHLPGVI